MQESRCEKESMKTDTRSPRPPFIKKFRTGRFNYVYDVNSNEIIRVDEKTYAVVDSIGVSSLEQLIETFASTFQSTDIRDVYENVLNAQTANGLFSPNRPKIHSGFSSVDDLKYILDSNLSQVVLEVTKKCNHRCRYCNVSGHYASDEPTTPKHMSPEIAIKAVDFFIRRSQGEAHKGNRAITFYGGEPLLEFPIIRAVVEHTKKIGVFDQFRFSLTTNGTLLTDDVIRYFAENKITIIISLDGPKESHDRYRVFEGGDGTYDTIVAALLRIKEHSADYFNDHVLVNAVVSPPYDLEAFIAFFFHSEFGGHCGIK